jgi:Cell Wall Hydrolase
MITWLSRYARSKAFYNAPLFASMSIPSRGPEEARPRKSAVGIGAFPTTRSVPRGGLAPLVLGCLALGLSVLFSTAASGTPSAPRTDIHCMAEAVYHEARGESVTGMVAVAAVVLNRSSATGKGVCDVIYERSRVATGILCQFSFTCVPAQHRRIREAVAWERSLAVAERFVPLAGKHPDPTNGAMFFRTCGGARTQPKGITRIGHHCFRKGTGFAAFKSPGYSGHWSFLHDAELSWSQRLVAISHAQQFEQIAQASEVAK